MIFKKLALAAAITTLPLAGFAMTEVADEVLSDVTGQDGIAINIDTSASVGGISADIVLHDLDGLTGTSQAGYAFAGAIVVTGFNLNVGAGGIDIEVDAGDNSQAGLNATTPTMHIGVVIPANTVITTGAISVANSQRDDAVPGWDVVAGTQTAAVLSSMTITLNGITTMDIQLGNEPQGHMIEVATTITGGLSLSGLGLNDAGGTVTGGGMGAATVLIQNAGAANLGVDVGMDATINGLVIDLVQIGAGSGIDIKVTDAYLGQGTDIIGDLYIKNLNIDGTIVTITGK